MFPRHLHTPARIVEVEPYQVLARIYDQVMDHVDYGHWARYLTRLARLHGVTPRTLLDISCGTGSLCQEFARKGCQVFACDSSLPMLTVAKQKLRHGSGTIHYWCAAMGRVTIRRPVDLIISSYDSMNYLQSSRDWLAVLNQAYGQLRPEGLFVFDISTLHNSIQLFAHYRHQERFSRGSYRRESRFDAATRMQYNFFEIELSDDPDCLYKEKHSQSIRPLAEIEAMIAGTPFTVAGCYADFTLRPASETADRIHFVLQKKES